MIPKLTDKRGLGDLHNKKSIVEINVVETKEMCREERCKNDGVEMNRSHLKYLKLHLPMYLKFECSMEKENQMVTI